jgi:hypothetical protein
MLSGSVGLERVVGGEFMDSTIMLEVGGELGA